MKKDFVTTLQGSDSAPAFSSARRLQLLTLSLFIAVAFVGTTAWAQVQQGLGALSGTVTDSSKAAIPGAHVTLTNPSIGYRKEAVTNAAGQYTFSALTVAGGYNLDVAVPGFASASVKSITTSVGTVLTQDVTLAVGSESTVIEVAGANEEQVQMDTSSISQVIDATVWQQAPLETRSQNQFVGLVAGAAPDSANTGRGYAINGARTGSGNFLVDGYDINDQGQGGAGNGGGAVVNISPDVIQEFRVITSTPTAVYGRSGGFSTDTVLRSGTNRLHGSAFEYNRNQAITANNFFSNRNGLTDHLVKNQFGGSVGGPIYRDKTFFYAGIEVQHQRQGQPHAGIIAVTQDFVNFVKSGAFQTFMEGSTQQNPAVTPDPNNLPTNTNPGGYLTQQGACPVAGYQVTGDFSTTCAGALSRSATLGPIFSKLLAAEPKAFPYATSNFSNVAQGLYTAGNPYITSNIGTSLITTTFPVNVYGTAAVTDTSSLNQNRASMKIDHKLTERDQLSFTYLADLETTSNNDGTGGTPGVPYDQVGGAQAFGATSIHTFSPTLVNVFKASYLRHVSNFEAPGTQGVPLTVSADSLGVGFGAGTGFPQLFTENQFSYEDSITKTLGRHSIKAGFLFKRTRNGSSFYNDVNGEVVSWSVEGLLTDGQSDADLDGTGAPGSGQPFSYGVGGLNFASASLDPTTGLAPDPYRGYRANEFGAYGQDDFKVSSRLTLNYGLRWEYFGPPHNFRSGIDSNVYFGAFGTPTPTGNPFLPTAPLVGGLQGASFQLAQANGRSTIWNRDTNNFAPRVGFAYDTLGNQKLVIRGGFGVGFDRLYNNVYENIRFNAPHFVDDTYGYGSGNGTVLDESKRVALEQIPFTGNSALAGTGAAVPRHVDERLVTAYYEQAHLGIESALPKGFVLETDYILTLGRKLVGLENINTFPGRAACPVVTKAYAASTACYQAGFPNGFSSARPSKAFGSDNFRTNGFSSNYNGAQVSLRKGYSNGLQLTANYTYSKAMDEVSDVFTLKSGQTGITAPYNPAYDYGPADFDVKHNFVGTANYVTRSEKHKLLLAGWGLSPIITIRSGTPIDILDGASTYSPNKDGLNGAQRAVPLGGVSLKSTINHNVSPATGYLKAASWGAYICPATVNQGLWCNPPVQRNAIYGPRNYNVDAAVSKHVEIKEHYSFTFQAAFFDLDNHAEFDNPVGTTNSGTFGQSITATNRVGQLSGRFDF